MKRHLPPLRALRAFEAAGRLLSFARAADELAVTPAAISQHIKGLEEWVGQPLFLRHSQLALTPAGQGVIPRLTELFDQLEHICSRLKVSGNQRSMVVSTSPSFAARWLLPRLDRFQTQHPQLDVRISATTRLVDFASEDVDVAIRFGPGHYPGLYSQQLSDEEVIPVAAPKLAERLHQPADLLSVTLLRNAAMAWDPHFPDWPTWLTAWGVDSAQAIQRDYGDEASLVIQAALGGLGVALAWRTLVADELATGHLVAVFPGQRLANAYHFVCRPRALNHPAIAAFRQWMVAEMTQQY